MNFGTIVRQRKLMMNAARESKQLLTSFISINQPSLMPKLVLARETSPLIIGSSQSSR